MREDSNLKKLKELRNAICIDDATYQKAINQYKSAGEELPNIDY